MSGLNFFDLLGSFSPLSPRINWPPEYGGGMPYMTAADAGGGGDDATGQPPVLTGTGSGPDGMMTAEEYKRSRAEPPVPRSLAPDLYKPLDLRSTLPDPAAPPPAPAAAPPPGAPNLPVQIGGGQYYGGGNYVPGAAPPGAPGPAPAVPGVLQPKPGGIFGGLFGGLLGGGGMTGPDGKELTNDQLMQRLLRMQLQRAMSPNWGAMAAAFAEAGKPSLLPTGGIGAALGKAAGALSAADGKDPMSIMKTMAEIQNLQSEQAARGAVAPAIAKFQAAYDKWAAGGKVGPPPTPPSAATGGATTGGGGGGGKGGLGYAQLVQLAIDKGFPAEDAPIMAAISMGESSGNPNAKNITDKEASYGITQINAKAHPGGEQALGNPDYAMAKAYELYRNRQARGQRGFEDWSVYTNGSYKQHLAGAQAAAQNLQAAAPVQLAAVPDFTASLGGVRPAATEGSGGGIPEMTAADAGGGGDDSGEAGPTYGSNLSSLMSRFAPPPVPGLMAADRQPPPAAPPPAAPAAPGPPAGTPPFMPQTGPVPSASSFMPQNIPQPNTDATQALMAQLAALRAATVAAKIGDPFAAYETLLTQSPQYIREKIGTEEAAKLPYAYAQPGVNPGVQGEIERQKQLAQYYGPQYNMALQQALGLTGQASKDMGVIGPNGFVPIPGYGQAMADRAAQTEQAKQRSLVDPYGLSPQGGAPPAPQIPPGPGYSEPVETKRGTVLPPRAAQAPLTGSVESLKHQQTGPGGWVETENNWNSNMRTLREVRQTALSVADIMKHYETGAFAGELSDFKAKAKALGIAIPDSVIQNDPAQAQKIIKENFSQTIKSLKGFDSNPAVYQIKLAFENWANTNLQPGANQAILAKAVGTADATEAMVHDWADAKRYGWANPVDFERVWGAQNNLQSFVDKATKQIGPLKGMPGTGAQPLPRGVPEGSQLEGTYKGKPVYRMPDGSRKVLN
jgi:hypothetical protein